MADASTSPSLTRRPESATTPVSAPAPYAPAPAPRTILTPSSPSGRRDDQMTHPPNGSFTGTPSRVTRARPAPEGAILLSEIPWIVGLAPSLPVRLNSETPGTDFRAASRRGVVESSCRLISREENTLSPASGGRRGASTTNVATSVGGMVIARRWSPGTAPLLTPKRRNCRQDTKKAPRKRRALLQNLGAGTGFEPVTFRL